MQRNRIALLVCVAVAAVAIAVLIEQIRDTRRLQEREARRIWVDQQRVLAMESVQHLRQLAAWAVGQGGIARWKRVNVRAILLELVLLPGEDPGISFQQERSPVRRERILKALLNDKTNLEWDASIGRWRVIEMADGSPPEGRQEQEVYGDFDESSEVTADFDAGHE